METHSRGAEVCKSPTPCQVTEDWPMLRGLGAGARGLGPHNTQAFLQRPQNSPCFLASLTSLWSARMHSLLCVRETCQWLKRESSGGPLRERKFLRGKLGRQPPAMGCKGQWEVPSSWSATLPWHWSPSPRVYEWDLFLFPTACHSSCLTARARSHSRSCPTVPAHANLPNSIPAILECSSRWK